jgi:hypothetical protein
MVGGAAVAGGGAVKRRPDGPRAADVAGQQGSARNRRAPAG